jgi:hypothetical protein
MSPLLALTIARLLMTTGAVMAIVGVTMLVLTLVNNSRVGREIDDERSEEEMPPQWKKWHEEQDKNRR